MQKDATFEKNALFLVRVVLEQGLCSHSALEYVGGEGGGVCS